MNIDLGQTTIRDIVSRDFRTAAVFQRFGLDFCCGGNRSVEDACASNGVDATAVRSELDRVADTPLNGTPRFNEWSLDMLSDYVVANHHTYVRENVPVILTHVRKVASVHGANHPETIRIAESFERLANELMQHMQKEEMILFPYIRALAAARASNAPLPRAPFGSIVGPITMMEHEHQSAGGELGTIRELSSGFVPPEDACTTYRISFKELEAFEADLHQHIHLENNILFPKAIALEQELAG